MSTFKNGLTFKDGTPIPDEAFENDIYRSYEDAAKHYPPEAIARDAARIERIKAQVAASRHQPG
jgi:hypothetical protein